MSIKQTSRQRKALRYQEHANQLFDDTLQLSIFARLGIMTEHHVTVEPARISALKNFYQEDLRRGDTWSGMDEASNTFIKDVIGEEQLPKCPVYNVEAPEFTPADHQPEAEHQPEIQQCVNLYEPSTAELCIEEDLMTKGSVEECDSGIGTPTSTVLEQVAQRLDQPDSVEQISFGEITSSEFLKLTSPPPIEPIEVDFLSDIHHSEGVIHVAAPTEAGAKTYYTDTPLGHLLSHCDSSLLVRSLVGQVAVSTQRNILRRSRPVVAKLLADATNSDKNFSSSAFVNMLADHCYKKTGRVFGNSDSRRLLTSYVSHLRGELLLRRFTKYLPEGPEYGGYRAAPRVGRRRLT